MEKGGGDDPARAVGMCDRFMTFLAKSLSLNRPKNITTGPRNVNHVDDDDNNNNVDEDDDDGFTIHIEKTEFEYRQENNNNDSNNNTTTTILQESTAGEQEEVAAEAAAVQQKKVKKSVTRKEAKEEEEKDAKKKKWPRPKMPVMRVPSNINERSRTYIEERRKSFDQPVADERKKDSGEPTK